jgi:dipeptidyl-peptidase-4
MLGGVRWSIGIRRTVVGAIVCVAVATGFELSLAGQIPRLTVDRVGAFPNLAGTVPASPVWSPDSSRVAFLWNDQGYPLLDVWLASATGGSPVRVTDVARQFPEPVAPSTSKDSALAAQAAAGARRGISEVTWSPDGTALIFVHRGGMYSIAPDGTGLRSLAPAPGTRSGVAFSPDGQRITFVQEGDLWFMNPRTAERVQVTHLAKPALGIVPGGAFSRLDVEIVSYRWSPNGRFIAVQVSDRTRIGKVLIPDYLGEETRVVTLRRDFPGENAHERYLSVLALDDGQLRRISLKDPLDRRFTGYAWSPDGSRLLVDQSSENVVHRWLYLVNPADVSVQEIWHDVRQTRTSSHWVSLWHADGRGVVFVSDKDGRHHLYSLPIGGGVSPRQLTSGNWSVIGESNPAAVTLSERTRTIFFVANQKGPQERLVYRIPEDGGPVTPVSTHPGTHMPYVSGDGRSVAIIRSDDVTPPELYIADASNREAERRVTKSPTDEFYQYKWVQPRYVTFKSRTDGTQLHGRLLESPNLDRTKKHAAILGPVYPNSVRNRWGDREEWRGLYSTFQQYLVTEGGYIVLQVDVRGSVGHGRDFREQILRDFGGIDVEDLHSGAEYLKTLPYVDPARLGIWGSSYGGLMTTMSLFKKPGLYKAGVASAPATNLWHATTGEVRVARRPDTDPEVFQKSSVVNYGENLEDHLLIVHGMQDDIVLFKDSVTLAEKLMLLGKKFDFAVAPRSVHPWSTSDYVAVYLLNKIADHFDRYLGQGSKEATP